MYALPYLIVIRLHRAALDARRRDRTWRYYAWSVVAGSLAAVLACVAAVVAWALVAVGWWPLAVALIALFAVPVMQPILGRHVLVPLGAVRTSYWAAHLVSMRDSDAYALCCAAWAHAVRPTPAGEAWLVARRDRRKPLGDAEIVVTALLAAARGDADTARQLMRSTADIVEVHPSVRELAGEWLACDAVERAAWVELAADARAARWPATPLTFFLEGVALRIGRFELRTRWLLAPHRRATRRFLDEAPPAPAPAPAEVVELAGDGLAHAIAAHVGLGTGARLAAVVEAWDVALAADATRSWLARRALELDAPPGAVDRAIGEVAQAVTDELARLAEAIAVPVSGLRGTVGAALCRRVRHGRLDALEAGFTRWSNRRHDNTLRAPIDEWREWCALRAGYDAASSAGGLELRRLAFPHAYTTGTTMAAWLWNARKEYAVSHAISAWLLAEALAVGDTEAIELCTRNVRLGVPTRTGHVT